MARYNTSLPNKTITGTTTIVTPDSGAFVQLAGTAPYTVTLPVPSAFPGSNFTFYNATIGTVTLSTPSGAFNGTGGSAASTVSIFAGNVVSVTSDGTNYIVISEDGSPLIATTGSFSSNVDVNGTLTVNPSGGVNLSPSTVGSINNVAIGGTTRSAGSFTALAANSAVTFTANAPSTTTSSGTVVITGGLGVSGTINAASVNASLTGTIQTASQPNITSVGTLSGLTVTNTITGSVSGSAATVTGAAQPNITSVGTLTGLTVTNTITGSVSGTASTVTTAAQPNITSLGTLTGLTVNGISSQSDGLYAERTFNLGSFPNNVANQVVYLNFGNNFINGNMEVTVTSTFNFQNATGILRKVFSFGFNTNNFQWYPATSRVSEADGPIRDNIVIGEMEWDSSGSQYRLPIYHVVPTANTFYAHVRSLGGGQIIPYITVSGFSTRSSPTTATASNFINIAGKRVTKEGDIAMWNGSATSATLSTIVSNNNDWIGFSSRYNGDSTVFETVGTSPYGIRIKKAGWVFYYYDQDIISSGSSGYITLSSFKNGSFLQYQLITNTNGQWDAIIIGGAVNVAANDVINFRLSASNITALDGGSWSNISIIWHGNGG
jgi:hypothetical protein